MDTIRWLVPFTWGIDMQAIDAIVRMADESAATLVAISLVSRPEKPEHAGLRPEHLQQSRDFLEAIRWKADRFGVALESYEVFTIDAVQSIMMLTHEMRCNAIVLASRSGREALLETHQLKRLLEQPPASLLVLRLAKQFERRAVENFVARAWCWLQQRLRHEECPIGTEQEAAQSTNRLEELLWIRTEEHRRRLSL